MSNKSLEGAKRAPQELRKLGLGEADAKFFSDALLRSVLLKVAPDVILKTKKSLIFEDKQRAISLAWRVLVAYKFKSGIKIGELNKRMIGNSAKELDIPVAEAKEFSKLIVYAIAQKALA